MLPVVLPAGVVGNSGAAGGHCRRSETLCCACVCLRLLLDTDGVVVVLALTDGGGHVSSSPCGGSGVPIPQGTLSTTHLLSYACLMATDLLRCSRFESARVNIKIIYQFAENIFFDVA
jgi:hypothetical protein